MGFLVQHSLGSNLTVDHSQLNSKSSISASLPVNYVVPQCSALGPILFLLYTPPIANNAASYDVSQQQYADDTLLFISITSNSSRIAVKLLSRKIDF